MVAEAAIVLLVVTGEVAPARRVVMAVAEEAVATVEAVEAEATTAVEEAGADLIAVGAVVEDLIAAGVEEGTVEEAAATRIASSHF